MRNFADIVLRGVWIPIVETGFYLVLVLSGVAIPVGVLTGCWAGAIIAWLLIAVWEEWERRCAR